MYSFSTNKVRVCIYSLLRDWTCHGLNVLVGLKWKMPCSSAAACDEDSQQRFQKGSESRGQTTASVEKHLRKVSLRLRPESPADGRIDSLAVWSDLLPCDPPPVSSSHIPRPHGSHVQRLLLLLPCKALACPRQNIWKSARPCFFFFFLSFLLRSLLSDVHFAPQRFWLQAFSLHTVERFWQHCSVCSCFAGSSSSPSLLCSWKRDSSLLCRCYFLAKTSKGAGLFSLRHSVILAFKLVSVTSWFWLVERKFGSFSWDAAHLWTWNCR